MAARSSPRDADDPAMAQVLADHRQVRSTLRGLGRCTTLAEARQRLSGFGSVLAQHFGHEEDPEKGLFALVTARAPHLHNRVEKCRENHRELLATLSDLEHRARTCTEAAGAGLLDDIGAFVARVRRHEARESELLSDSWCIDLGEQD